MWRLVLRRPIKAPLGLGLLIVMLTGYVFSGAERAVAQSGAGGIGITGVWIDHTGGGAVELKPCGREICGFIVWLKVPTDATGRPLQDRKNQDPAKRTQSMCQLPLIGGGTVRDDGSLEGGWIYNPDDGARYSVDISRIDANRLKVHGYLGLKLLGETFEWRKAPDGLVRCTP